MAPARVVRLDVEAGMVGEVSIKARVIFLTLAILVFMAGMIVAGLRGMETMGRHERVLTASSSLSGNLHKMLRGLAETIVIPDTPETVATARQGMEQVETELARLRELVEDPGLREDIDRGIGPLLTQVRADARALLARGRLDPDDVQVMIAFGRLTAKNTSLLAAVRTFTERSVATSSKELFRIRATLGAIAIFAVGASALFFFLLYRSLVRPLRQLADSARSVSEGNLSVVVEEDRRDEVGILARSFALMTRSLADTVRRTGEIHGGIARATQAVTSTTRDIAESVEHQKASVGRTVRAVDELQQSSGAVAESVGLLTAAAEASSGASSELLVSITEVSRNAAAFHGRASETVGEVRQMIGSSDALARSIRQLDAYSEETSSTITEIGASLREIEAHARESAQLSEMLKAESKGPGMEAASHALEGMRRIEESVSGLAETVQRLGSRSGEIGSIVSVIDEVTRQTNLLALNAAILAAQAGEHGKGFAVVADEIRSLADRTSASTKEIARVVADVQQESAESIIRALRGVEAVAEGKTLVARVHDALRKIDESAEQSSLKASGILRATTEEVEGVNLMAKAVVELRDHVLGIAREVQAQQQASARVQVVLEEFMTISGQIRTATHEQAAAGGEIARAAEQVADQASQISAAVGEQGERSREVLRATRSLDEKASELIAVSRRMAEAIAPLSGQSDALAAEMKRFSVA